MNDFLKGCKLAIPIMLGYIPIAISFGILASHYNFSILGTILMSATVFAGASQFLAVEMSLTHGVLEIVFIVFMVNLRHLVMTYSLTPTAKNISTLKQISIFSGITDETYSLISLSNNSYLKKYSSMLGLVLSCYLSWVLGTIIGVLFATIIPETLNKSMNVAIYSLFVGLLVHALLKKPKYLNLVIITIISNMILSSFLSLSLALFICISIIPALYLLFFQRSVK